MITLTDFTQWLAEKRVCYETYFDCIESGDTQIQISNGSTRTHLTFTETGELLEIDSSEDA